jgi:hypothetical protein
MSSQIKFAGEPGLKKQTGRVEGMLQYTIDVSVHEDHVDFVQRLTNQGQEAWEQTMEGWMAIRARDDQHMVATVSKKALYTFQNREYSCIHSAPTFGALAPGETGNAFTRVYFVEANLVDWYERMTAEFADIDPKAY